MGYPKHTVSVFQLAWSGAIFLCCAQACVKLEKPPALVMCTQTADCKNLDKKELLLDGSVPIRDASPDEPNPPSLNPDTGIIPMVDLDTLPFKDAFHDGISNADQKVDTSKIQDAMGTTDANQMPDTKIEDASPADGIRPNDTQDTRYDVMIDTPPIPTDQRPDLTLDTLPLDTLPPDTLPPDTSPDIVLGPCSQNGLPAPQGTVCRASTDQNTCDPIEYCDGTSFDCPTDIIYLRPSAPYGVTATLGSSQQATISWNGSSHATGYAIKRSTVSGTDYTTLASVTAPPYIDIQRTNGVNYYYILTAIHALPSCESIPSSEVTSIATQDTSLLGFWRFDEITSPYSDSSGNGYEGIGINSPTSGEGKIGAHSLKLNGSSQAVCIENTMPPPPAQFSEVAWIKITNATSGVRQTIMGYHDDGVGLRFYIEDGRIFFQQYTTGVAGTFPSNPNGKWTHVAGTYDGTTWQVYVNGNLVGSAVSHASAFSSGKFWCIGRKPSQDSNYFDGEIDEVRLYNRALMASEIQNLFQFDHP